MNNNSNNNENYILAIILSLIVIIGFQYFYVRPQEEYYRTQQAAKAGQNPVPSTVQADANAPAKPVSAIHPRADVIKETPRINIVTPELMGSINLKGALLDDLNLVRYHEDIDPASPKVVLLSPAGSDAPHNAYYAAFGWLSDAPSVSVPTDDTQWKAEGGQISSGHALKLTWDNGAGLSFERLIAVDDHYMFTVTDRVSNKGASPVTLRPYSLVTRQGNPVLRTSVVHEGAVGILDGSLDQCNYNDMMGNTGAVSRFFSWVFGNSCRMKTDGTGGWAGFTSNYWLVTAIPPQNEKIKTEFTYEKVDPNGLGPDHFRARINGDAIVIAPGTTVEHAQRLFAGVKKKEILADYQDNQNVTKFSYAIDYGFFWFLTRPFLALLDILGSQLGSFGLAILVFTVMLKGVTLPLSLKAYHGMAKMKAVQPQIAKLKERYASDQPRFQQEMMLLYKKEKVNPVGGCLPTMIQIPIFFALYKVLYIDIGLRQAPFYGWIHDMSVSDPTSLFTLFGTIAWTPPAFLHIGAWPALMGCSMYLQQKLSPQPPDPAQARMFTILPFVFIYMMAQFPAGLVIYWTWSNLLGIGQQWYIMWHDAKMKARSA